jgi:hypothetical protein
MGDSRFAPPNFEKACLARWSSSGSGSKAVSLAALMALHTIQYPREMGNPILLPNYPEERESERPMITVAGYVDI